MFLVSLCLAIKKYLWSVFNIKQINNTNCTTMLLDCDILAYRLFKIRSHFWNDRRVYQDIFTKSLERHYIVLSLWILNTRQKTLYNTVSRSRETRKPPLRKPRASIYFQYFISKSSLPFPSIRSSLLLFLNHGDGKSS